MAKKKQAPAAPPAEVVGNAFVEQYYHVLHTSPEMVHRFYQDSSLLSRPDANGVMTKVTTMREINEKIISLNYKDHTAEIETVDAQDSHEKGVIVLVTGCLTGRDNARRKFTQTFFLAPKDFGYFVLNDVFRYVGESESLVNGTSGNAPAVALTPGLGTINAPDHLAAEPAAAAIKEKDFDNVAEVCDPLDNEGCVFEEETIESLVNKAAESNPAAEEDAPKTYASILKAMQGNAASRSVNIPSNRAAAGATSNVQQSTVSVPAKPRVPVTSALVSDNAPESGNHNEEGHSIYIRNLPYNATVELLEEVFRKFGPIKPSGVQVRSTKKGLCYGFVEFEASSSMQSALQASPITIKDHQAVVEEKRSTNRVTGNSRSTRGGFCGDSFTGRGHGGGGRGHGKNKFGTRGGYSGRPRDSLDSCKHHREQEQEQEQEGHFKQEEEHESQFKQEQEQEQKQEQEQEGHFKQEEEHESHFKQEEELEPRRRLETVSFQYLNFYSFLHCILPCFFPSDERPLQAGSKEEEKAAKEG